MSLVKTIKKILWKRKKMRFCKLNGYFCPECIYHDFIWENAVFRGNICRFQKDCE